MLNQIIFTIGLLRIHNFKLTFQSIILWNCIFILFKTLKYEDLESKQNKYITILTVIIIYFNIYILYYYEMW